LNLKRVDDFSSNPSFVRKASSIEDSKLFTESNIEPTYPKNYAVNESYEDPVNNESSEEVKFDTMRYRTEEREEKPTYTDKLRDYFGGIRQPESPLQYAYRGDPNPLIDNEYYGEEDVEPDDEEEDEGTNVNISVIHYKRP
jgi:hypothetical protein